MDLKPHARHALGLSRRIADGVIASLKTSDEWFYQSHPKANPPIWIVAHLGLADNMFSARFRPQLDEKPAGWDALFWYGSEPKSDRTLYPSPEEVLAYFRERRETLLKVLDEVSEEELNAPGPKADERDPMAGVPCIGYLFLFAAFHESIHAGQLTVAHRGLGNPPLFG